MPSNNAAAMTTTVNVSPDAVMPAQAAPAHKAPRLAGQLYVFSGTVAAAP